MHNVIMHNLNSFFTSSIINLILSFLSRLFTIKNHVFSVLQVLIPTVIFSHESNY